jgi:hypothetical protein
MRGVERAVCAVGRYIQNLVRVLFQEHRNFIQPAAAADTRGLFVAFHNREETSSSSCARQKQSANLGVRSPAGQFHGYWSYTWQKTVRAERVDAVLSLFGAHCAGDFNERSRLFVFALRDARFKTLTQFQ